MNEFYSDSGAPAPQATGASATIRAEFVAIRVAFDKMPTLTANASLPVFINTGATGMEAVTAASARTKLGVTVASRVQGLLGAPNATTPLTKYDLSADAAVLRDSTGGTVTRYVTGTITNDLGLVGSAANGRDQAAAFAINTWIYLYFIWNGTTLATISSTAVHTTGPALPTGYTHWAFATALRWNGSSNINPALARGCGVLGAATRVLAAGVSLAPTFAAVSLAATVPPIALLAKINFTMAGSNATVSGFNAQARATGTSLSFNVADTVLQVAGGSFTGFAREDIALGTAQQLDYQINAVPTTGGLYIDVLGYTVPNGDA